jgi:MGT family glycosyltransferase
MRERSYMEIPLSNILVCSVPLPGHVEPMLSAAHYLRSLGHNVTFNTSDAFRTKTISAGLRFVPFTGIANLDDRSIHDARRRNDESATTATNSILRTFAETIPDQHLGIQRILNQSAIDVVITDTMFFGSFPMLLGPRQHRPPVIALGVNSMMLSSRHCGLVSPPDRSPLGQRNITEEMQQVQTKFQPVTNYINLMLSKCDAPPLPHFFLDCLYLLPDFFLQLTAQAFEFPRPDMPDTIRFVGPLLPRRSVQFDQPAWWAELDGSKPVVLVTQGTVANNQFSELIQPTLSGLATEEVTVIAATGRADTKALDVPANARVASFVPFDRILPKVDVFVTNGGYGAVNHALSLAVPIVAAGETEDKAYVAARIEWSRAGINLHTRHPGPEQIRAAVRSVLNNQEYRSEARRLQSALARYDAKREIARAVTEALTQEKWADKWAADKRAAVHASR